MMGLSKVVGAAGSTTVLPPAPASRPVPLPALPPVRPLLEVPAVPPVLALVPPPLPPRPAVPPVPVVPATAEAPPLPAVAPPLPGPVPPPAPPDAVDWPPARELVPPLLDEPPVPTLLDEPPVLEAPPVWDAPPEPAAPPLELDVVPPLAVLVPPLPPALVRCPALPPLQAAPKAAVITSPSKPWDVVERTRMSHLFVAADTRERCRVSGPERRVRRSGIRMFHRIQEVNQTRSSPARRPGPPFYLRPPRVFLHDLWSKRPAAALAGDPPFLVPHAHHQPLAVRPRLQLRHFEFFHATEVRSGGRVGVPEGDLRALDGRFRALLAHRT
jgi:hypothetical protein